MLRADVVVLEALRLLLGEAQNFPGPLRKFVEPVLVAHLFISSLTVRKVGAALPRCVNRILLLQEHPGLFLSHHYISFRPIREDNESRAFNLINLTVGSIRIKMYESPLTHLMCTHKF